MSQALGKELTEALFARLNGSDVQPHEGKIIPLLTIDERGWAHPALLSYYEVIARDRSTLEMALWKDSSTARNLRRSGKVTLIITDRGVNYYVKGTVAQLQAEMAGAPPVSHFRVSIEELIEDQEPNAQITSGMTYSRRTDRAANDFAVKVLGLLRAHS
jgi:hypothetical protein